MNSRLKQLLINLREGDLDQRTEAAEQLALVDEEPALRLKALMAALDDEDDFVRSNVIRALRNFKPRPAGLVGRLLRLLKEGEYCTRLAAMTALSDVRPVTTDIVTALVVAIDDEQLGGEAMVTLGELGPDAATAVPRLIAALHEDPEDTQAMVALGEIGPAAAASAVDLCRALSSTDTMVVIKAAAALGKIGPAASDAVPKLLSQLDDQAAMDRAADEFNAMETGMIPELKARMHGLIPISPGHLRFNLALALWRTGRDKRAARPLAAALKDDVRGVRLAAIEGLAGARIRSKRLAAALGRMAWSDPDKSVRWRAILLLPTLGPAASVAVKGIAKALDDEAKEIRKAAGDTLGKLGPLARPAASRLRSIVKARKGTSQLAAAAALWHISQDQVAIDCLVNGLSSRQADTRRCAAC